MEPKQLDVKGPRVKPYTHTQSIIISSMREGPLLHHSTPQEKYSRANPYYDKPYYPEKTASDTEKTRRIYEMEKTFLYGSGTNGKRISSKYEPPSGYGPIPTMSKHSIISIQHDNNLLQPLIYTNRIQKYNGFLDVDGDTDNIKAGLKQPIRHIAPPHPVSSKVSVNSIDSNNTGLVNNLSIQINPYSHQPKPRHKHSLPTIDKIQHHYKTHEVLFN